MSASKRHFFGCGCCCAEKNRIAPESTVDENEVLINASERINGWTCPLHPLQVTAWLFIVIFSLIHFGILVNYLPRKWKAAGNIVSFSLMQILS